MTVSPTFYDRVRETTTTVGTGTLTLLGAVTPYQDFSAVGDGNQAFYTIVNRSATEWEVGIGTYTLSGTTLSRTTVLRSSNANALVNFSAGTKDVFLDCPAAALPSGSTQGALFFGGPNTGLFAQDPSNFFYNSTLHRLGIGTNNPQFALDVSGRINALNGFNGIVESDIPGPVWAASRNAVIDGNFDFWQRGSSFAAAVNNQYAADRWKWGRVGSHAVTISRVADRPGGILDTDPIHPYSNYCLQVQVTTAQASLAAGDYGVLSQPIEGFVFVNYWQRFLTLSFWVKSSVTGTFCCCLRSGGQDKSYPVEYTILLANTWERKTVSFPASPSTGTWNPSTSSAGAYLDFCLGSGSTFQQAQGTWYSANYLSTLNQVNLFATNTATWAVSQVQIELGGTATPFELRQYPLELEMCQRYYEKSYLQGTDPATATSQPGTQYMAFSGATLATGSIMEFISFRVVKRTTPTITIYPYTTPSNTGRVSNVGGTDLAANSGGQAAQSDRGFGVYNNSGGAITPSAGGFMCHWAADAEL